LSACVTYPTKGHDPAMVPARTNEPPQLVSYYRITFLENAPPVRPYQGLANRAASAWTGVPERGFRYRNLADIRYETAEWPHPDGLESAPKDTKTKGFVP